MDWMNGMGSATDEVFVLVSGVAARRGIDYCKASKADQGGIGGGVCAAACRWPQSQYVEAMLHQLVSRKARQVRAKRKRNKRRKGQKKEESE